MAKILRWVFATIAAWEAVLLLFDSGGPEVMATEMLSLWEVRLFILLASSFCLCFVEIMNAEEKHD